MLLEMEAEETARLNERSNALRLELKAWEKDFASKHEGRKAGRDDIKKHRAIADKYKDYNRLRDTLSGKLPPLQPAASSATPRKRKHGGQEAATKCKRIIKTPSKTPSKPDSQPWEIDPYGSPSLIRNLFTPAKNLVIGPTPQKDGQVLGIFDLLQEDIILPSPSGKTPVGGAHLVTTPRKLHNESRVFKHSRTPASSSKRRILDMLATPLKDRQANGLGATTPSSISKMATPSFLKRHSQHSVMAPIAENEDLELFPKVVQPGSKRPLVRSLSSMLASLRKMEDDAADDDLEALREVEAEPAAPSKAAKAKDEVEVPESQHRLPLGGFDDEAMLDSEPEEKDLSTGHDGKPSKVWKKKGQKRTTRRVKMKPSRSKPAPAPAPIAEESEDEIQAVAEETFPETQLLEPNRFEDARNFDSDSQSEYTASEGGTRYKRPDQEKNRRVEKHDDGKKAKKKKANTVSHQNFKRLKLRNSGAKGGPGHGSRFKRRK